MKHIQRFILFVAISVGLSHFCMAQETRFSAGIRFGPSVPVGEFARYRPSFHDVSGNAVPGITGNIRLQYRFAKSWALTLQTGGSQNGQNNRKVIRSMQSSFPEGASVSYKAKKWKVFHAMAGVNYAIPLSGDKRFELQPGLYAGWCKTSIPGYKYSYAYGSSGGLEPGTIGTGFSKGTSLPWSFCYQTDLAFRFHISKRIALSLDVAYFDSRPVITYYYYEDSPPGLPFQVISGPGLGEPRSARKHYALSSIATGAGIAVKL